MRIRFDFETWESRPNHFRPTLCRKLFYSDGSIMPRVTTGNTMAPCVIIGERAAEVLRAEHKL
jgi:choline dehydrogenase-like flavoprotein